MIYENKEAAQAAIIEFLEKLESLEASYGVKTECEDGYCGIYHTVKYKGKNGEILEY
jgi:hypothetical protein